MDAFIAKQRQRYQIIEGSVVKEQIDYIQKLVKFSSCYRVAEIGFNGGLSAASILSADPHVSLVSFDLGYWDYVVKAKKLIDECFPGRHELILGDSQDTVPKYHASALFDLVFVDGCHQHPVPELDIRNILKHVKESGLILVDDYCDMYGRAGVIDGVKKVVDDGLVKVIDGPIQAGDRGWILLKKTKF